MPNFDNDAKLATMESVNLYVPWWLMASYLYYHCDFSLLSDTYYDQISKEMLDCFDEIEHRHKYLIDKESLQAGSGFAIKEYRYPLITKSAAKRLMKGERC